VYYYTVNKNKDFFMKTCILIITALMASGFSMADSPRYNYIGAGISSIDYAGAELSGPAVTAGFRPHHNIALEVVASDQSSDGTVEGMIFPGSSEMDSQILEFKGSILTEMSPSAHVALTYRYGQHSVVKNTGSISVDSTAFGLEIRGAPSKYLEITGGWWKGSINGSDEYGLTLGARARPLDMISVGALYQGGSGFDSITADIRYEF
jgi:hypothetical protein